MQISGVFKELPVLKAIGKNVKTITICDYSEEFDLYQLNQYGDFRPESIDLHTAKYVYFSGADLQFLEKAKRLRLYLYNPDSEILFDDMGQLSELEEFTLFSPFAEDLDYESLLLENECLKVRVYTPELLKGREYEILNHHFIEFSDRGEIQAFDYPFGDLLK